MQTKIKQVKLGVSLALFTLLVSTAIGAEVRYDGYKALRLIQGFKGEPYPFSDPALCP